MRMRILGLLALMISPGLSAAEVEARLEWLSTVKLSTPVSGRVAEVAVQPGQAVARGERLLALDPRPFRIELEQATAELKRVEARFEEAESEWDRSQQLFDRALISDHDLELARIAYAEAEAELSVSTAALKRAELALDYSRLQAPFDAWVLSREIEPGELVLTAMQPQPLLSLAPRGRMAAVAQLKPEQAARLQVGDALDLRHAGKTYRGRLLSLSLAGVDGDAPRLRVEFEVDERARPGETATLLLP